MGHWVGVGSDVIDFEIDRISDPDRHLEVASMVSGFSEYVSIGVPEHRRGLELERWGFGPTDALHVACGEKAQVDALLTTDDHLLRKANRHAGELAIRVANPLTWLEEVSRK
jgi:predicted nucleic acid-binding protein